MHQGSMSDVHSNKKYSFPHPLNYLEHPNRPTPPPRLLRLNTEGTAFSVFATMTTAIPSRTHAPSPICRPRTGWRRGISKRSQQVLCHQQKRLKNTPEKHAFCPVFASFCPLFTPFSTFF